MNGDTDHDGSTVRPAPGPDRSGPAAEAEPHGRARSGGPYEDLYTARACSANGRVTTGDGLLDVAIKAPRPLGGPGTALNPEQLLAAAYAACFHSALALVAGRQGADASDATVETGITMRKRGTADDYAIAAEVTVRLPGADPDAARRIADEAHRLCPYSRAFTDGAPIRVQVVAR